MKIGDVVRFAPLVDRLWYKTSIVRPGHMGTVIDIMAVHPHYNIKVYFWEAGHEYYMASQDLEMADV